MKPRWLGVVLVGFILAGVVLMALGAKVLVDSRRFQAKAVAANGVIVDVARIVDEGEVSLFPIVEFVTPREQVVRFQADEASPRAEQRIGDSVRILYDPASPRHVRLDTGWSLWGQGAAMVGIGFFFVTLPGAILLLRRNLLDQG
jgi:hypothetical protein